MLEAVRRICAERAVPGAARARGGDGLRLRRLLRLRRADPRRLSAALRRRPGGARRRSGGGLALTLTSRHRRPARSICGPTLAGLELEHPVLNGSGTFDAIAALRTFGDELREHFPFSAFVSKTITLEPRGGNPPPRLWETPGRPDQLDRPAQQGARRLPRARPAGAGDAAGAAGRQRRGLLARGVRPPRRGASPRAPRSRRSS